MEDEYPMLLDTFLADSEVRLKLLRESADTAQLMDTAHSFKGSSSNMGAIRLAALCHDLERGARRHSLADIKKLVEEIDREYATVRPLYEAERKRFLTANSRLQRY
nr:Hpt domain-containing protein [Pseudomonas sp. PB120]